MRIYRIVRFGSERVRYAEIATLESLPIDCITISSCFPRTADPSILWNETKNRSRIKKMEIHSKNGNTLFEMSSSTPIEPYMDSYRQYKN